METQDSRIELYEEPRSISADQVLREPVTALLVAGIVNPYGPTLTSMVVAGEPSAGARVPLLEIMLNPFSQEFKTAGEIVVGKKWRPSEVIRPLFDLTLLKSCPSLLIPSVDLEQDQSVTLHAEFLRGFPDSRGVLKQVRQRLGNPWARVSKEMSAARRQLSKLLLKLEKGQTRRRQPQPLKGRPTPLREDEARELATLLLSEKHLGPEIQAFFYAWNGAIKRVSGELAATAMSFETFADLFEHIVRTCRLPDLHE